VQRTGGGVEALYSQMHVNQGVFQIFMSEQDLNGAEIRAGFIEMCRKTVAKSMRMNAFLEAGALGGFLTCVPNGFRIDGPILAIVAGEQPGAGLAMVETPIGAEGREESGAEHDTAILATLTVAGLPHHGLTVDVADF